MRVGVWTHANPKGEYEEDRLDFIGEEPSLHKAMEKYKVDPFSSKARVCFGNDDGELCIEVTDGCLVIASRFTDDDAEHWNG